MTSTTDTHANRDTEGRVSLAARLTPARIVAFAVLASIPVKLLRERLVDPDLWWHMRTGAVILDRGVPRRDVFSYTANGEEWVVQGWAADVFLQLLREWFGLWGPFFFRAIALLVVYALVARILVRKMGGGIATFALLGLVAYAGAPNWTERPNLLSFILFVVTLSLLDRKDASIWWFVPIAALWANLHGMVILGIGLVGLVAFVETLKALAKRGDRAHALRLWLVTIGSVVAMMANPVGWKLIRHTIRLVGIAQGIAQEWQSPSFHEPGPILFMLLLFVAVATLAYRRIAPDPTDLALVLAFTALALQAQRNLLVAAIVIGTRTAGWIADIRRQDAPPPQEQRREVSARSASLINVAAIIVTVLALAIVVVEGFPRSDRPQAIVDRAYPIEMIDRLDVPGVRVFAHDFWSGMVIDRAWPNAHVFVDLRWDFYGLEIAEQYSDVIVAKPEAIAILDRTCTTHLIVPARDPISQVLRVTEGWHTVGDDPRDVIPERKALIFERDAMPAGCDGEVPRV